MIEFLFFQKIILEKEIFKHIEDFKKEINDWYGQDLIYDEETHYLNFENPVKSVTKGELWHGHGYFDYLQKKYEKDIIRMIPKVRERLDDLLLNRSKREEYISLMKKKCLDLFNKIESDEKLKSYKELNDYFERYVLKLEEIVGEPFRVPDEIITSTSKGLNINLSESQREVLESLYHLKLENQPIIDQAKTSLKMVLDAFTKSNVSGRIYFVCKTKDLAYILDSLYYLFDLGQSKRMFFKSIQDSNLFVTKSGTTLTASNISKNITIGASPFKSSIDTFFKRVAK